jgi:hypothetical protein
MINSFSKRSPRLVMGSAMIAGALAVGACAHDEVPLQATAEIPAAQGQLKVSTGDSGNTKVDVEVAHLADPERVRPGATNYVVWVQSPNGRPQNVGALKVGDDQKGELETTTPYSQFQIFITAEPYATAAAPTSDRLMFANVRK